MAKAPKETKAPAPAAAPSNPPTPALEAARAAKAAKAGAAEKDVFVRVLDDSGKPTVASKKLAPQAQGIVNLIEAAGPDGLVRSALTEKMKGVIVTRQPESRILSYYQKQIVEVGCVKIVASAPATAAAA